MNRKLVNQLKEKWASPDNRPAKGAAIVDGCSPCAQTEALMLHSNKNLEDIKKEVNPLLMDNLVAKALDISVTHAILLRRFNDFSSEDPSLVLTSPEKILGPNYKKVLRFWEFLDTFNFKDWGDFADRLKSRPEWESRKKSVLSKVDKIGTIVPDLFYRAFGCVQGPEKLSELDVAPPRHNDVPDPGYFSWISAWDFCLSSGFSNLDGSLPIAVAYATLEIQYMGITVNSDDLYFCNFLGYNPKAPRFPLTKFLRKARKFLIGLAFRWQPATKIQEVESVDRGSSILLLDDLRGAESVIEVMAFANNAKLSGHRSFILGLPKGVGNLSNEMEKMGHDLIMSLVMEEGYKAERMGDTSIRAFSKVKGFACWKVLCYDVP